jgi:hypothetical protein
MSLWLCHHARRVQAGGDDNTKPDHSVGLPTGQMGEGTGSLKKEGSMTKQALRIVPKTSMGRWSVGLIIAMLVLFLFGSSSTNWLYGSVPAGRTIPADIVARPVLALSMLAGMVAGVSAFIVGLLAIIRQKERGLLVYASTLVGLLLLIFLSGEIVSPH